MLTVTVQNLGDEAILRCQGRIVCGDETAILCAAAQQHGRNVILDLSRVDAIDASGIGVLVSLQAAGIYLKLMNPIEQVRGVLRLTNLESVFEICESQSINEIIEVGVAKDRSGAMLRAGVEAIEAGNLLIQLAVNRLV